MNLMSTYAFETCFSKWMLKSKICKHKIFIKKIFITKKEKRIMCTHFTKTEIAETILEKW